MQIHVPSSLIGVVGALLLFALLGANGQESGQAPARFQLRATANHVFILDRYSGKVWEKFVTEGSGQTDQDFALPKAR